MKKLLYLFVVAAVILIVVLPFINVQPVRAAQAFSIDKSGGYNIGDPVLFNMRGFPPDAFYKIYKLPAKTEIASGQFFADGSNVARASDITTTAGPTNYQVYYASVADGAYFAGPMVTVLVAEAGGPTGRQRTVTAASNLDCDALGLKPDPNGSGLCFPEEVIKGEAGSLVASTKIGELIKNVLNILLTLAGVVAVLFLIIGSFLYMTAAGNETQSTKGKKTMTVALVGLAVSALAYAIVTIVYNTLTKGSVF